MTPATPQPAPSRPGDAGQDATPYARVLDYLYHAAPMFQNIGAGAYKEGLATTRALDAHFGHPHRRYRTIHVAGTNGKGSVSSSLAAVLQAAGLRVGLYTSPHLVDFRERIRVNGQMISEERVVRFVEQERPFFEPLSPSFFELTTALAFLHFAEQGVDVAVVEVGLGGRLDCTNIIRPDLSIITNISFDHQQLLGSTLRQIAAEKAGIIKPGVPVVVGQTGGHPEVRSVFLQAAAAAAQLAASQATDDDGKALPTESQAPAGNAECPSAAYGKAFPAESQAPAEKVHVPGGSPSCSGAALLRFADEEACGARASAAPPFQLRGAYQAENLRTILCAVDTLSRQPFYAPLLTPRAVAVGLSRVCELTGLRGRWEQLRSAPAVVCDCGHNEAGIRSVAAQLSRQEGRRLHVVVGMVADKDYAAAARLFAGLCASRDVCFYLTSPSCRRALPAQVLAQAFREALGMPAAGGNSAGQASSGHAPRLCTVPTVAAAARAALDSAAPDDFVFVGGSCYVVADLLAAWPEL